MSSRERFKNYSEIIKIDPVGHRRLILDCLNAAVNSVLPEKLMKNRLTIDPKHILSIAGEKTEFNLKSFDKLIVVGGGKASGAMAQALEQKFPKGLDYSGVISVPEGTTLDYETRKITQIESSHPIPSEKSLRATVEIITAVKKATRNSLIICLISGGGSSLMTIPASDVTLADKVKTTSLLLRSGASIEKVNSVRKHLSLIKGGQLVTYANGATILSLIISDIVGNPLMSIASGPTSPDPTTFKEALDVLKEFDLLPRVPARVVKRLKNGTMGKIPETPKPHDPIFARVTNVILGDNSIACKSAIDVIKKNGNHSAYYLSSNLQGESRDLASNLVSFILMVKNGNYKMHGFEKPCAFIWGGETTVTVRGKGKGGRNQEEALAALRDLGSQDGITVAFLATDGKDGFSTAAGAIIDAQTDRIVRSKKLNSEDYLQENDSNTFFRKVGSSLLVTGATGTNVDDIGLALVQ